MTDSKANWLTHASRYFWLRGSGWQRRRLCNSGQTEWRDPQSGLWYHEAQAFRILQDQALALYDRKDQPRRPYGLRC